VIHPLRVLTVRAGGQVFGIEVGVIGGLERPEHWARLPGAPPYVRGVVEIRDRVVPVIDLAVRLGLDADPIHPDRGVVLIESDDPVAVAVEELATLDVVKALLETDAAIEAGLLGISPEGVLVLDAEAVIDGRGLRPLKEAIGG